MQRYADFFLRHPRGVLALAVLGTLTALFGLTRVGFDDTPRGIIRSDDAAFQELEAVRAQFGADDNDLVLVLEREDWFDPDGVRLLRLAEERARAIEGVEIITGLAGVIAPRDGLVAAPLLPREDASPEAFGSARERALAHPLVGGVLLSEDARVALVAVRLAGDALTVEQLEPPLDALTAIARELEQSEGTRAVVTGVPAFRVVIFNTIRRDQIVFTGLGALVCFVISVLIFRSVRACLVVTLPTMFGGLWVIGGLGVAGDELDLLGSVLPVLCILIAFTDSVHLAMDVQSERAAGHTLDEAIHHALRKLGMPCLLTSITTAIGLGSLAVSGVPSIRHFAIQAFFSVLVVFSSVMITLPVVARFADPPPRALPREHGRFGRFFAVVLSRPRMVVLLGVAATLAFLATASRLVPENRLTEAIPHDREAFAGLSIIERSFGGMLPLYVLVEWPEGARSGDPDVSNALAEIEALLASEERLVRPTSILGLRALLPRPLPLTALPEPVLGAFLREDLRRTVVVSRVPDMGTVELRPMLSRLEGGLAEISEAHPELRLSITGTDVVARKTVNRMIEELAQGLALAMVLIFAVIAIEFRSLGIGLVSLLPNVFPLAFVGALIASLGLPLQIVTAVLFTVLLGLAVDDTIHYLARFRHERSLGAGPELAARRAGAAVGAAILTTTLALAAGYSVVFASQVPTNRLFAALLLVGLVGALIGDLILLPALLVWRARRQDA